jgi:hypothetical protein
MIVHARDSAGRQFKDIAEAMEKLCVQAPELLSVDSRAERISTDHRGRWAIQ